MGCSVRCVCASRPSLCSELTDDAGVCGAALHKCHHPTGTRSNDARAGASRDRIGEAHPEQKASAAHRHLEPRARLSGARHQRKVGRPFPRRALVRCALRLQPTRLLPGHAWIGRIGASRCAWVTNVCIIVPCALRVSGRDHNFASSPLLRGCSGSRHSVHDGGRRVVFGSDRAPRALSSGLWRVPRLRAGRFCSSCRLRWRARRPRLRHRPRSVHRQ